MSLLSPLPLLPNESPNRSASGGNPRSLSSDDPESDRSGNPKSSSDDCDEYLW